MVDKHHLMVEMHKAIRRQPQFLRMAGLLRPFNALGKRKIRVGSQNDGGYIMLDDFDGVKAALSYGVETNADWDLAIVERGPPVFQYDHSISAPPVVHPKISWQPKMISAQSGEGAATLAETLREADIDGVDTGILKMDIEGSEWDVFEHCRPEHLTRLSQIVVEFHALSRCNDDTHLAMVTRVMKKLTSSHFVFHVHANNWSPLVEIAGVWFPDTIELSFASRSRYEPEPSEELFPTAIDQPCNPMLPEVWLGSFRFGAP